jgi:Cu+-exporting ATPase
LGILIRDTAGLDKAHRLDALVIDKTGTLTQGQPKVIRFESRTNIPAANCLRWIAAPEEKSEHPLSKALVAYARERGIESDGSNTVVNHFKNYTGRGIAGTIDGNRLLIGNPAFLTEQGIDMAPLEAEIGHYSQQGETVVIFALNSQPAGLFSILDPPREESAKAIRQLRVLGIQPVMLTGDSRATALNIGKQAGLLPGKSSPRYHRAKSRH